MIWRGRRRRSAGGGRVLAVRSGRWGGCGFGNVSFSFC